MLRSISFITAGVLFAISACTSSSSSDSGAAAGSSGSADAAAPTDGAGSGACTKCGSTCDDTNTNAKHCGVCYNECSSQLTCVAGKCSLVGNDLVFEEIYRAGAPDGDARLLVIFDDILHFRVGQASPQRCNKNDCATTAVPTTTAQENGAFPQGPVFFPWRKTSRGYFANGYYLDAELSQPISNVAPAAVTLGDAFNKALFADGTLFYGCTTKQACPSQTTTSTQFSLFRCATADCTDYSKATALSTFTCPQGTDCPPRIHVEKLSSGKEWALIRSAGASKICPLDTVGTCDTTKQVSDNFKVSGDVFMTSYMGNLQIAMPDIGLYEQTVDLGAKYKGLVSLFMSAGEDRKFFAQAEFQYFVITFDAQGKANVKLVNLPPVTPKTPGAIVGAGSWLSDGKHLYRAHTEQDPKTLDRFAVISRAAL